MALAGERFTLLDNVDSDLGGAPLDAALTSDTWKDRMLGTMQSTAELPMKMVWFASGNNLGYRGDFLRRVLPCRLESSLENPEERTGFKYPDLIARAIDVRGTVLWAILTILRAHRVVGQPADVKALGSFEEWTRAIVDPVAWITEEDPLAVREELRASDRSSQCRGALVEGWAELPDAQTGVTVGEALRLLREDKTELLYPTLRSALADLSDKNDLPSARSLGRYLKGMQGRTVGIYVLRRVELRSKLGAWRVETTTKP